MVDVPLTDEIKALGISKVEITSDQLTVYNGNASVRSRFYKSDLERTLQELQEKMIASDHFDDQQAVEKIIVLLSSSYVNHEEKQSEENKKQKSASYAQVYKLPGLMAEAIMVGQTPLWLVTEGPGRIEVVEHIDISENRILKPIPRSSYINRPYEFKTLEEVNQLINTVATETLDNLYYRVNGVWRRYIRESDDHLSICSADCIFTYFQDKMGLTHYLFFVGDNDSGKSTNLHVINFLAYRNMLSSDMTAANIYSFLGCEYEGLGTICEDEADNIDQDRDKMKIYKNGYTAGIKVHRLDLPPGAAESRMHIQHSVSKRLLLRRDLTHIGLRALTNVV